MKQTYIQQAIEKAVEGGYNLGPVEVDMVCDNKYDHHFLSPLFWQCLGVGLGWKQKYKHIYLDAFNTETPYEYPEWLEKWHRFTDHLAEKKPAEDFFRSLLENNK